MTRIYSRYFVCRISVVLALVVFPGKNGRSLRSQEISNANKRVDYELTVGPSIPLPVKGSVIQLISAAAPDDANRIFVCTSENDSEHGIQPSGGYVSLDGGNTWVRTLYERSSRFVSETSCAVGENGRTYLVASASDTSHGSIWHARGTTMAYRSMDGGLSWQGPRRYPFLDWTALAVSGGPSPEARKVYLFGNHLSRGFGDAGDGEWFDLRAPMSVSDDGLHFAPPTYPSPAPEIDQAKSGYFPIGTTSGPDGTVLAAFATNPKGGTNGAYVLYKAEGKNYSPIGKVAIPASVHSPALLTGQIAADPSVGNRTRLYIVFPATEGDKSTLMLGASADGGQTWALRTMWSGAPPPRASEQRFGEFAAVAVNKDGLVGVEWLTPGGCPMFAVSVDHGESFEKKIPLGACREGQDLERRPNAAQPRLWSLAGRNGFATYIETAAPYVMQITADESGRFHAFWNETREDGSGSFVTAVVSANSGRTQAPASFNLAAATELKTGTVFDLIEQQFDPYTGTFDVDVAVQSVDNEIPYPSALEALEEHSDCEPELVYSNPSGISETGKAVFSIPRLRGKETLLPGERTFPVHLQVRAHGCASSERSLIEQGRRNPPPGGKFFSPISLRFRVLVVH